jgi:hypothetical protein
MLIFSLTCIIVHWLYYTVSVLMFSSSLLCVGITSVLFIPVLFKRKGQLFYITVHYTCVKLYVFNRLFCVQGTSDCPYPPPSLSLAGVPRGCRVPRPPQAGECRELPRPLQAGAPWESRGVPRPPQAGARESCQVPRPPPLTSEGSISRPSSRIGLPGEYLLAF